MSVAIRDDGRVALGGWFTGSIDFGDGSLTASYSAGFLAGYDANGALLGSRKIERSATKLAFDAAGDLLLLDAAASVLHVAKVTADGDTIWDKALQGTGESFAWGLRLDAAGEILISGVATGPISFGPLTADAGQSGLFVLKLDSSGEPLWLTAVPFPMKDAYSASSFPALLGVAVNATGAVAAYGHRTYDIIAEQKKVHTKESAFAVLDAQGSLLWSRFLEVSPGETSYVHDIAVDAKGQVAVSGGIQGTADLGTGPITSVDGSTFMALYDAAGAPLWVQSTACTGARINFDADGNLVLFNGDVVRLDPSGTPLGASFYDISKPGFMDAAFGPNGLIVAAGEVQGVVDFGQGPQTPPPHKGAFVGAVRE
jgi:hypothetical protein